MQEEYEAVLREIEELRAAMKIPGRWYLTGDKPNEWEGVCARCGRPVPAFDLKVVSLPFNNGYKWVCKEGCQ